MSIHKTSHFTCKDNTFRFFQNKSLHDSDHSYNIYFSSILQLFQSKTDIHTLVSYIWYGINVVSPMLSDSYSWID